MSIRDKRVSVTGRSEANLAKLIKERSLRLYAEVTHSSDDFFVVNKSGNTRNIDLEECRSIDLLILAKILKIPDTEVRNSVRYVTSYFSMINKLYNEVERLTQEELEAKLNIFLL